MNWIRDRTLAVLAVALAVSTLTGCASEPVFVPRVPPLRWPGAPAAPRVEFVGSLSTSADLKAPRSLGEVIFGDEEPWSMQSPYAVCTDGGDRLFVCDGGAPFVHVFDLEARRYERWRAGPADAPSSRLLGVAWDSVREAARD